MDDGLEENLATFADLDTCGRSYEVLLGLESPQDAACGLAHEAAAKWPGIFRVVHLKAAPGLNPKINQLISLLGEARYELLLISDSNVRVPRDCLRQMLQEFEEPEVGCVVHPVVGIGEQRFGALLDNLQMASGVGAGMIAASWATGRVPVVGKSMALRRSDLQRLGGFAAVKDFLAEDYILGEWITSRLGKRVVVTAEPVFSYGVTRSISAFFQRYARWAVIQRALLPMPLYLAQLLLNPSVLSLAAGVTDPSVETALLFGACAGSKTLLDFAVVRELRKSPLPPAALPAILVKDLVLFASWTVGLVRRKVNWRGNALRVEAGTRLVPLEPPPGAAAALSGGGTGTSGMVELGPPRDG